MSFSLALSCVCVTRRRFVKVRPELCLLRAISAQTETPLCCTTRRLLNTRRPGKPLQPLVPPQCVMLNCAPGTCTGCLLSLNGRLVQPSERRPAHRLGHQSRWADHSEYIESLNSVKSSLGFDSLAKNTPQLSGLNVTVNFLALEYLLDWNYKCIIIVLRAPLYTNVSLFPSNPQSSGTSLML